MDEKAKTTMSVSEMRRMLGLGKTDSYWLVHRNFFDTILVEGKMRIVIESFEKWYANQIKWKKVNGEPPGKELEACSYSIPQIAELLGVKDSVVYEVFRDDGVETFTVDTWKRVRKDVFETWYHSQSKYRTPEDRERDAEREEATMSMPEMARLLLIPRSNVYHILYDPKNEGIFEFEIIADRKRVTKESFERWYAGQSRYRKLCDRSPEEQAEINGLAKEAEVPRLKVPDDKPAYDLQETAILLDLTYNEVRELIRCGDLEAKKLGVKMFVRRDDIQWFLLQQKLNREE